MFLKGFPGGLLVKKKNLPANAGDVCSIQGSGRSSEEENGNPLQYSCLRNPIDRGARWATVLGAAESDTTEHAGTQMFLKADLLKDLRERKTDYKTHFYCAISQDPA